MAPQIEKLWQSWGPFAWGVPLPTRQPGRYTGLIVNGLVTTNKLKSENCYPLVTISFPLH